MITYTITGIAEKVREKLDEVAENESEMMGVDEDNYNLNTIVKSCIPEAYRFVSLYAHPNMLEGKSYESGELSIDGNLVGHIALPNDFLRLLSVRLESWVSSCSMVIDEDSAEYRMQSNKWTSGNKYKPVAALVQTASGRELELYKASSDEEQLKSFIYIPIIDSSSSTVEISSQTADAFIYYVAALAMVTLREDVADKLFALARNLLGLE